MELHKIKNCIGKIHVHCYFIASSATVLAQGHLIIRTYLFAGRHFIMAATLQSKAAMSAASALTESIKEALPRIYEIIEACKAKPEGIMQPSVDKIVEICLESDCAYRRNVMAHKMGIHPDNRQGTGVDAINAQDLALKISKQGYSETKLESPMGFEKAMEGKLLEDQIKLNAKNFSESSGFLKEIP